MIRVLNIHWGFIPGGVAKYASLISNVGQIAPIEMKSICVNALNWPFDQIAASKLNMKHILISSRLDLSWIWKVRKTIRQEKPDLIFTYGFNGNFVALNTAIGQGVPVVSSWHGKYVGTTLPQKLVSPLVNFVSDILLKYFVKNIVTVSDYSMNILARKSIEKKKIIRIYNGISPLGNNKLKPRKACQEFSSNEELLIGTVCRLDSTKDLPTFLKAIKIVSQRNNKLKFVIWGEGPLKHYLEKMANALSIQDRLTLPGYLYNVAECLNFLDIFVLPSKLENFSIILLEAMRAGLPIVATNIGGNPEAVHNDAVLVSPESPKELAQAILKLSDAGELRKRLGTAARERFLNNFTENKMVAATAKWLLYCAKIDDGGSR